MEGKRDLRVVKTKKLLYDAMKRLISRYEFSQMTVNELCGEALVSRATFYVYFEDKFDFLRNWLTNWLSDAYAIGKSTAPEKRAERITGFIHQNYKIIENILSDADNETMEIVLDVLCSFSTIGEERMYPNYVVLRSIYAGGIVSYLKWQTKNKFPKESAPCNDFLYNIVKEYLK